VGLLSWILVGLVAGWLADMVMGNRHGLLGDLLLGIVGALLGGFLAASLFGLADPISGFNLTTLLVAFLGAILVVMIVNAVRGRRTV
jgi:uncharacterized membrane protein YeaQ/YmgE (transglycosylase-associated protein family)